jgi:Protein of unknown function (DUF4240)
MNQECFWKIIADCNLSAIDPNEWSEILITHLRKLPPEEIIEWNHIFDRFVAAAYTYDLIAACIIINWGACDDGLYYFRCWLVGMGQAVYEAALIDPDSLAAVVDPHAGAESGIFWAAHQAWMFASGQPDTADYPARNEYAELKGDEWDVDNNVLRQQHLPKLFALCECYVEKSILNRCLTLEYPSTNN